MPLATKNANFILEIGAEELPAGQIKNIIGFIKEEIEKSLQEAEIEFANTETLYSPRRLCFDIKDINLEVSDKEIVVKGPPEKIAKAEDGSFTQAALGFAKKNELTKEDLYFENSYLMAKKTIKANSAKQILSQSIPEIIARTPGIRFMRWRDFDTKFARPIEWISAIFCNGKENEVLEFELDGLKSGTNTFGHRILSNNELNFNSLDEYRKKLEENFVFVCPNQRKKKIIELSEQIADSCNATLVYDEALLEEVIAITESPQPILCDFDAKFLEIPDPVLKTVMIQHQRYFPLADKKSSQLINKFIAISNNPLDKARQNIKLGNEKVIVPRLKDAEFFVQEDRKTSLEHRLSKLEKLNFLKGTFLQKSERLVKISKYIIEELQTKNYALNPENNPWDSLEAKDASEIELAAKLCKADLNTNLVFEFTELQGEIGGIYAQYENYSETVAKAIADHYKPRFAGDEEPESIGAKILAIADKLDNIVIAFALGKIPSGSADPFALRRQANGMLEIIVHNRLLLNLDKLTDKVIDLQKADFANGDQIKKMKGRGENRKEITVNELDWQKSPELIKDFIQSRFPFVFEIYHTNKQINKAVFDACSNALAEINKCHMMIHLISALKTKEGFEDFVQAASRVTNIAKTDFPEEIQSTLFEKDIEKDFDKAFKNIKTDKDPCTSFEIIYSADDLISLTATINQFFDDVLVNAEDTKVKANRQALVKQAANILNNICDWKQLSAN